MTALYFSFVTLATLRYGDIVPNERGAGVLPSLNV
jgi:ion channel